MERRSRSWALGLSLIGFFAVLFSLGFVQQVKADDVSEYGTVIGIVRDPAPVFRKHGDQG
jgi:heat shock protein 5